MIGQFDGRLRQSSRLHTRDTKDLRDAFTGHAFLFADACQGGSRQNGTRNANLSSAPDKLGCRLI